MSDWKEIIDMIFDKLALPSTQKILEAMTFVESTFPDLRSRQAFLGMMVSRMCEEFGVDLNSLLDNWKEVLL